MMKSAENRSIENSLRREVRCWLMKFIDKMLTKARIIYGYNDVILIYAFEAVLKKNIFFAHFRKKTA